MVYQWVDIEQVEGPLVLFTPDLLPEGDAASRLAADTFRPACWRLDPVSWELTLAATSHLGREHEAAATNPQMASAPLLSHLLAALLLRATAVPEAGPELSTTDHEVFHRYRVAVERGFRQQHQVADYERALGYGQRALARATRAATGLGAKQFLDQRILLEAKRLLSHTSLPVAVCGQRVGFDDPANFSTFFRRQTGQTPREWRAENSVR